MGVLWTGEGSKAGEEGKESAKGRESVLHCGGGDTWMTKVGGAKVGDGREKEGKRRQNTISMLTLLNKP